MLNNGVDVGVDNRLRERVNSNVTNIWVDGPINQLDIPVLDADQVGLLACWYGNSHGDVDWSGVSNLA